MINDKKLTTFHREAYTSPSVAVTGLEGQGRILDGSEGSTQNYNSNSNWWLLIDDND